MARNRVPWGPMVEGLRLLAYGLRARFKSRARLEAENLVLRQQLGVLIRKLPKRLRLTNANRLLVVWLYRLFPSILNAIQIVRHETVIRWHRRGFRAYWRWRSRPGVGRPLIDRELRDLIRQMSTANPVCVELQLKRRPGSERGHRSAVASDMSRGVRWYERVRRCAEPA